MSDRFERRLAAYLGDFLEQRPPQPGQILLAKFHSETVTDTFAEAIVDELSEDGPSLTVDGEDISLPTIRSATDVPMYIVRVVEEIEQEDPPDHVVVQGFATQMRNLISVSAETGEPRAMLMIMDTDTSLDTLEASEDLLADDGPINLDSFRDELLNPEDVMTRRGRALLQGLRGVIGTDSVYADDTQVLEVLCAIRDAIEADAYAEIPELISKLPTFIYEDFFDDDQFLEETDEELLTKAVKETLKDNGEHAGQLRRAHRAGTDTESRLSSNYDDTFVNKVLEAPAWSKIRHSEARKHKQESTIRQFRNLEFFAARQRIFDPLEDSSQTRKAVVLVTNDGEVRITAEFSADLDEAPFECVDANGERLGRVSKRENRATAVLEDLDPQRPQFAQFLFYIGKKTTRGKPTHQFDIAIVPEWFYIATEGVSFDVDVEREALVALGDDTIELTPPERLDFEFEHREVKLTDEDQIVEFKSPLTLRPTPPDVVERISCLLTPPEGVPVRIDFLTEASTAETEDIVLPLMLSAIIDPDSWAQSRFRLPEVLTVDTKRGEIYSTADEGARLEDENLELLQIEEHIINQRTPAGRTVDGDSLEYGTIPASRPSFPAALESAYDALFEHFDERGRTPSTSTWDDETQSLVRDVLTAYQAAIENVDSPKTFGPYAPLRNLGTIRSTATHKEWLTPFHPVTLAYGLRMAQWRDETLAGHATKGFRREEFSSKFNPVGLLPYRAVEDTSQPLRGMRFRENPLWLVYSPVESPSSVTPTYMDRVIRDKLYTFVQAFPVLFSLHSERQFVINVVNMGDLRPVVKGLYEFYRKISSSAFDPPTILLRIYGGEGEGEALERFFTESAESRLRVQLEKKNDELVDLLRSKVRYIRAGQYVEQNQKEAHITLFRGLLRERSGVMSVGELPSGTLQGGLFPRESIDVDTTSNGAVYTVGFSCDASEQELIHDIARTMNALEAGANINSFQRGQALKKNVEATQGTDLGKLWDDSLWVSHVQPNVGIEFYLRSDADPTHDRGALMIHYSDQYDSSSPNYDVITSTNKREPYLLSLKRALVEANLSNVLQPEAILSRLVAVDGELALELQRANETQIVELIGFVGGLALSRELLTRSVSDHVWIPISLNELARHDRSHRTGSPGLFQFDDRGKASDDLCFVGVPTAPDETTLKLWLVETKGGSARIATGREQIKGALNNLREWLLPTATHADDTILYGEFGKVILDVARRMFNYDVLSSDAFEALQGRERSLLEGNFDISFIEDTEGSVGEVIRVRQDTLQSSYSTDGSVRAIEVPLQVLKILTSASIEEALPDLDLEALEFDLSEPDVRSEGDTEVVPASTEEPERSDEEQHPTVASQTDNTTDTSERITDVDSLEDVPTDENASDDSDKRPVDDLSPSDTSEPPETGGDERTTESTSPTAEPDDTERSPRISLKQSVIESLQRSPDPETDVNTGKLASQLKRGFESMGVAIHPPNPSSISIGPRKIGVDILPKEGQKIEQIINSLDSLSVHIQAQGNIVGTPMPAKGAVHLEIPHDDPRNIYLREGLEALAHEFDEPLTVPIGVDTDNTHHALSLLDERHALIGGATGSGKSNFLSTVISSLAITNDPEMLTMSLLDPKGVDFERFDSLPHVRQGGYFDTPADCTNHLMKIVQEEVPRRREHLSQAGVTSLAELHEHAEALGVDPLPFHVVIIDEYADLTMSADDEDALEEAVTRLAQIGRALGIVILLATQRPSADIVSGKIKTNFPCRISFRLPSNTDSRVILDEPGAEDLQGSGDMIVHSQSGKRYNLQGYYLTPPDAKQVIEQLSE